MVTRPDLNFLVKPRSFFFFQVFWKISCQSHRWGFEPTVALVICETRQVLLAGDQVVFLGDIQFSPHLGIDSAQNE